MGRSSFLLGNPAICVFVIALWLGFVTDASADETVPTVQLRGAAARDARALKNAADRMRSALEQRFTSAPKVKDRITGKEPDPKELEAEIAKVTDAYQEVIRLYPHTSVAAETTHGLCGLYTFFGQSEKAVEISEQAAKEFAGTPEGVEINFTVGLHHLQVRHDPAEAMKWFSKISKSTIPADGKPILQAKEDKLFMSAQKLLIKCELQLQREHDANERLEKLKALFPQYAEEFERSYQFELKSRDSKNAHRPPKEAINATTDDVKRP